MSNYRHSAAGADSQYEDDVALAREAIRHLSPRRAEDRDLWIKLGMALQTTTDELLQDWIAFSSLSDKFKPGECEKVWRGFKSDKARSLGIGSLIRWAREDSGDLEFGKPKSKRDPLLSLQAAIAFAVASANGELAGLWTYTKPDGSPAFWVVRINKPGTDAHGKQKKEFRPIHQSGSEFRIGDPPGPLPLYRLHLLPEAGHILVVEGEKPAETGAELGLCTSTSAHGSQAAAKTNWQPLAGRDVVILPDKDPEGVKYALAVGAILQKLDLPARVRVLQVPEVPEKGDLHDFVDLRRAAGKTETEIRAEIEGFVSGAQDFDAFVEANRTDESEQPGPPEIQCGPDLHESTNTAELALASLCESRVYTNARSLVVIAHEGAVKIPGVEREPGAPFIHALVPASLREHLSRAATWWVRKENREEPKQVLPPGPVVAALAARASWPYLPRLAGIVEVPTMREDGSILDTPGYDPASGLFYDSRGIVFPRVPDEPTREDVQRAIESLKEPFLDFEWENEAVDLAVVLSLILTPPARPTFAGTSPGICFDSTTRGSGKGLACAAAVISATGRRPAVSILASESEEQRKALFALSLEGHRCVLLDNITRPLGGAVLSAALTSGEIRDRLLGLTKTASAPFSAVLIATGNNIRFFGDFDRRVLVARQSPSVEYPEDRAPEGGFRHPDLLAWVSAEYPRLVVSALTILRAYWQAGRPAHGRKPMGSFEGWDSVVRGACIWAGIGDPLDCQERIRAEADDDRQRIEALLSSWKETFGSTAASVAEAVERATSSSGLAEALAEFDSKGDPNHLNPTSIGRRLRSVVGRIVGGWRLERVGRHSPILYRVGIVGLVGSEPLAADTRAGAHARAYARWPEATPSTPSTPQAGGAARGAPSEVHELPLEALFPPAGDLPEVCYACKRSRWWRLREKQNWVCGVCHSPPPSPAEVVWFEPAAADAGGGS